MATSKVIFSYPSGETLVVKALPTTGNAYLFTSTAVAEAPANSGLYTATFTELVALSGAYRIVVTLSGTGVASYQARWTGSDGETVVATEFVDVSQIATAADLATIDTNVDSILVDTGTTIPAQISALNNFDPASDTVANVTLCATTTTNTDMRGTNGANTVVPDNTSIAAILTDTGTTLPAQISALNNVAATDIVSAGAITTLAGAVVNVDLCDVVTTNTDMRGTNGANTVVPVDVSSNVAAIKSKTDQFVFSTANQVDAKIISGGGGGDATLANQTAILARLQTNPIEITNPLADSSTLVLINHDNYSANNGRLINFPVTTNYASATSVKLVFETNGTNIKVASAVVASATLITVDLVVDFGSSLTFTDCSGSVCNQVATCDFALIAKYGTDEESIARGAAYIYDRAKE
jgi:hypothetical protein